MTTSLVLFCLYKMGWDSVDVATRYGLDGPGIESRWAQGFSALVQTSPGGPPSLL